MKESTRNRLIELYKGMIITDKSSCLLFRYQYNPADPVRVNLYFDAYDNKSTTSTLILICNNHYYFKPLNILNTLNDVEYLEDIPSDILDRLLDEEDSLKSFFEKMETVLETKCPRATNYDDTIFQNTKNWNRNDDDLPFWLTIRHTRMSDRTLKLLSEQADISTELLYEIQRRGFTLVRTDDYKKRKTLTFLLKKFKITLD